MALGQHPLLPFLGMLQKHSGFVDFDLRTFLTSVSVDPLPRPPSRTLVYGVALDTGPKSPVFSVPPFFVDHRAIFSARIL